MEAKGGAHERASRAVAAEMRARGIRLQAYNTEESADDIDAVRQALGEARWSLWGRSYGSHLALATARRHPEQVERMVLIGPEGPDHTWKLPSRTDTVLQRIAERAGAPEMLAQLREATTRLARAPLRLDVPDPATGRSVGLVMGALDLQWVIAQVIGDPRALATLPAAAREMAAGDFRRIGPLALLLRRQAGVGSAMKHMMDLSSDASAERRARIEREAAGAVLGDAMNWPGRHLHGAWQAQPLAEAFRQPVAVPVPTLLLAGDLDARTPVENAREIAAALPRAHLVVVENAAHQFDVFGNPQMRGLLRRFLRGEGDLPTHVTLPPLRFEGLPPAQP
ncbi:alpha/beta hydrolase [Roseateles sp.]|uniref:alpha/beta hydrolase n=1 Tax=Roseateles sp. TaxID=1971397 RepID=UPI003263E8C3